MKLFRLQCWIWNGWCLEMRMCLQFQNSVGLAAATFYGPMELLVLPPKPIFNFQKLWLWTLSMLTYWCCFDVEIKKIYHYCLAKRHIWSKVSLYLLLPGILSTFFWRNLFLQKSTISLPLDELQWCIQICLWRQSAQKFSIHKRRRQILRNRRFVQSS